VIGIGVAAQRGNDLVARSVPTSPIVRTLGCSRAVPCTLVAMRRALAVVVMSFGLAGCSGTHQSEPPPRMAVQLPKGPSGPSNSPGVIAGFAIQNALNVPVAQATMESYLGSRWADDWIVNNGKRGILYIGVVHLTRADKQYATKHIRMGADATFQLVSEKYSLAQLNHFQKVVEGYVESGNKLLNQHPFASFGVSAPDNAIDFEVPKKDAAFWIERIQPLIPYNALVIQYGAAPQAA